MGILAEIAAQQVAEEQVAEDIDLLMTERDIALLEGEQRLADALLRACDALRATVRA